jgi:hypothetical protein
MATAAVATSASNIVTTIEGVQFLPTKDLCLENAKKHSWVISYLKSWGNLFVYYVNKARIAFSGAQKEVAPYATLDQASHSKKRLVVCLHGLNNDPRQFVKLLRKIKGIDPANTAIFMPPLPKKGNEELDIMTAPLIEAINAWAQTGEDKEIVFVGTSNGSRVIKDLEAELSSTTYHNVHNVKVISIVGAWNGSALVNLARKLHLTWLMKKPIAEEMPVDSAHCQKSEAEWYKAHVVFSKCKREYFFLATRPGHDDLVPNYSSTLPDVGSDKAHYAVVSGHGHNSIVPAVTNAIAQIIFPTTCASQKA